MSTDSTQGAVRQLIAYRDAETLALAEAHRLILTILDLTQREPAPQRVDVALTGGSDTLRAMRLMANDELLLSIDWNMVHFWWADERFVPADSTDRNALQSRIDWLDSLVEQGLLPEQNIHEMPADERSEQEREAANDRDNEQAVEAAAERYERELIKAMGESPAMDISILGMGPDGHFASLFPSSPQLSVNDKLVVGITHSPKLPPLRISLTVPILARSARTWFFASGAQKAEVLAEIWKKPNNPLYPASFASATSEYIWFITRDMIAKL